jgi:hypothetical protein
VTKTEEPINGSGEWLYWIPGKFDPFDIWMYVAADGLSGVWTSKTACPHAWHPGQGDWVNLPDIIDYALVGRLFLFLRPLSNPRASRLQTAPISSPIPYNPYHP